MAWYLGITNEIPKHTFLEIKSFEVPVSFLLATLGHSINGYDRTCTSVNTTTKDKTIFL